MSGQVLIFTGFLRSEGRRMIMTEWEVMISCCGEDEFGNTKATAAIKLSRINLETFEEEVIDEMLLDNPIINIFRNPRFTMLDLTFTNKEDFEFVNLAGRLQSFTWDESVTMNPEGTIGPTIIVTLIPKESRGEYFCVGIHGLWVIMQSMVGAPVDTVRFIFDNELFTTYQNDLSDIDIGQIEDELMEEIADEYH